MTPATGTRQEWEAARRALLEREKELTRASDALALQRLALPEIRNRIDHLPDRLGESGVESDSIGRRPNAVAALPRFSFARNDDALRGELRCRHHQQSERRTDHAHSPVARCHRAGS